MYQSPAAISPAHDTVEHQTAQNRTDLNAQA